jgi:DNA-binding MarR family transcriptional regulator
LQYLVMLALWSARRDWSRHQRLAAARPGTLSPLLKPLQALGYLTRQRSDSDERMLVVDLNETGRRCAPKRRESRRLSSSD